MTEEEEKALDIPRPIAYPVRVQTEPFHFDRGPKRHYTVAEVAGSLRVTDATVLRWIENGELVAIKIGSPAGYRITDAQLGAFIEARTTSSSHK